MTRRRSVALAGLGWLLTVTLAVLPWTLVLAPGVVLLGLRSPTVTALLPALASLATLLLVVAVSYALARRSPA